MRKILAKTAAVLVLCSCSALWAGSDGGGYLDAYTGGQKSEYRYQGTSGARYKYDLSNPYDRMDYSTDVDAQRQDSMSLSPNRSTDRLFGQFGGGINPDD